MERIEGESRDHLHHRGLWFSYNDVNGIRFWENDPSYTRPKLGRIVVRDALSGVTLLDAADAEDRTLGLQTDGGLRVGGRLYVVEADEYDRSFLALRPDMAVVTTIEPDHMEIYGDLQALDDAFVEFLAPVPADGLIAICADDAGAARVAARLPADRTLTYGMAAEARLRATRVHVSDEGTRFHVERDGQTLGEFHLAVPGRHNVRNALATLAVAIHAGADIAAVRRGFEAFAGVDRRFQRLGEKSGIVVVDDYAHHPTEVAATMAAARERFASRRLVAVFQPHLYSRTRDLWREFGTALAAADAVWVTDVFAAREDPIEGVTGELVAKAAREAGAEVRYHPVEGIDETLAGWLEPGDVCVLMSAGDLSERAHALMTLISDAAP